MGDRGADVEEAHVAGLKAVGVTYGYGAREELCKAEEVIEKMGELAGVVERLFEKIITEPV